MLNIMKNRIFRIMIMIKKIKKVKILKILKMKIKTITKMEI
jgi:hypothetical protein